MKNIVLLFICVFTVQFLSAQHWATVKAAPEANFFEKQTAFQDYWEGKEYEKGKGYKQFKRWEWFWEQRVGDSGEFPSPTHIWDEYERYTSERKSQGLSGMKTNANWEPIGPVSFPTGPDLGRVSCLAEDPSNSNILYAGTPGGGLWKSLDAGSSWTPMTDHLPTLGVSGVVVDPVDTDIVYIATGDGDSDDTYSVGVLKSYDGGFSWEATGLSWQIDDLRACHRLIMSPEDNQTLFVATTAGLWRTTTAGAEWEPVLSGEIEDVEFHPTNAQTVYACGTIVFRSTDGGDDFSSIQSDLPASSSIERMSIAVSQDEPDWLYVLAGRSDNYGYHGLYRSTDSGDSFSTRSTSPNIMGWSQDGSDTGGQAWYDIALGVDPNNASRVFVGGVNLWRSTNGGSSWSLNAHWIQGVTSNYVHADLHELQYNGNRLYSMSDGGLARSTNNGVTFNNISNGISNTQYYKIGLSQSNENMLLAGAQDNGTHRMLNGNWNKAFGGDGMECVVHPTNSNTYYVSTQYGNIRRTVNGGNSYDFWSGDIPETGGWVTPYMLDPNDPNTLFVGYQSLWKRTGFGPWEQLAYFPSNIDDFSIAPSNSDVMYISRGSFITRSVDAGENWETMDIGVTSLDRTDIAFNPDNEDEVFVTLSGFTTGKKVVRTLDGGETWENITLNLPNFPANAIVYEPGSNGGIYVGMDVGIYYTNDDLASWIPYDAGLPRVPISELEFQIESGKLRAATYGRGVWQSDLFTSIDELPTADFLASDQVICVGEEVSYLDLSTYHEPGWDWQFPGAFPSNSVEAAPTVLYSVEGAYEVSLSVVNTLGEDQEVKSNYIHVLSPIGEQMPYAEGFESFVNFDDTERWFIVNEEQDDLTWEVNNTVGNNSSSSVWIDNFHNADNYIDRMYSSTIDLSGAAEVEISMDVAFAQKDEDDKDKFRVYVSSNCGGNYSLKKSYSGHTTLSSVEPQQSEFFPTSDDQWHNLVVNNLNETHYVEGFRFQLYFRNDGGNNVFVDNININYTPLGLEDVELANLNLQLNPNPSADFTQLSFFLLGDRSVTYEVLDMTGRVMQIENLSKLGFGEHKVPLDASGWAPGIYIVSIDVDGVKQQMKWVLR